MISHSRHTTNMRVRRWLSLGIALGFLFPVAATAAGIVDDGWVPPNFPKQGHVNVTISDNSGVLMGAGAPHLEWRNGKNGPDRLQILCKGLEDPRCSKASGEFIYFTRLAECSESNQVDCIEAIVAVKNGKEISGKQENLFPTAVKTTYLSDKSVNLPIASSGGLWNFNGISHAGGEKFFVNAVLSGSKDASSKTFETDGFSITISAVEMRKTTKDDGSSYVLENSRPADGTFLGAVGIYPPYEDEQFLCVMSGDNLCAHRRALPEEIGFRVILRLSSSPSGWLHGRIDEGALSIASLKPEGSVRVTLEGKSVRVPSLGFSYPWPEIPRDIQEQYRKGKFNDESKLPSAGCRWCSDDPLVNTLDSHPLSYGPDAFQELDAWIGVRKDKADADLSTWSVRTLSSDEMDGASKCFAKKSQVNGFVATNATIYSAGPPKLNKGSLDYQVAAPHLRSDGSEVLGRYKLIIRSDVARCVYGFTDAPVSAVVTVTGGDGNNQVATTSVVEREGWISLSADNFTFSSPTIKVKLEQQQKLSVKKSSKTITCTKGSTTKRVTGVSPQCPKGFKQRS